MGAIGTSRENENLEVPSCYAAMHFSAWARQQVIGDASTPTRSVGMDPRFMVREFEGEDSWPWVRDQRHC